MVKKNENIVNDYLTYYEKYKKMFGKKVLILMQIGSFHEAYCTEKRGAWTGSETASCSGFLSASRVTGRSFCS